MKKTFLLLLLALNFNLAFAQSSQISPSVTKDIELLQKSGLNLNDTQLSRITMILKSQELLLIKNKEACVGNPILLNVRLKELHENKIRNLKGAMSSDQSAKFDALKLSNLIE